MSTRLRPARPDRGPFWTVRARVTAPGDFPEELEAEWHGHALTAGDARAQARAFFEQSYLPPITILSILPRHTRTD